MITVAKYTNMAVAMPPMNLRFATPAAAKMIAVAWNGSVSTGAVPIIR